MAAPFFSNALEVFPAVARDAAVRVSAWPYVPSPRKTPRSGIAGSPGRSVFDLGGTARLAPSGRVRGCSSSSPRCLLRPAQAGDPGYTGLGEVLHFRFHSLVTHGARRLSVWSLGFVHPLWGKVHSAP